MELYRQKLYEITNRASSSFQLSNVLVRAYRSDYKRAYEVLKKLPNDADRIRLMNYINRDPFLSPDTVQKMVDTFCFYRVTIKNNERLNKIYYTNNFALLDKPEDRALLAKFAATHQFITKTK